jgi:hypothetical protein
LELFCEDFTTFERAGIMLPPVPAHEVSAEPREVTMHAFQVQPVSRLAPANRSAIARALAVGRLRAFVAALLGRSTGAKQDAVPHYEGHGWCDSLERQVNGDIATCRRARL